MSIPTVTVVEANDRLQTGTLLLDVREDHEWDSERIPGAVHAPMSRFMDFVESIPKDAEVLVQCRSGQRSGQVAAWLGSQGYAAFNVAGGIMAWSAAGLPLEP